MSSEKTTVQTATGKTPAAVPEKEKNNRVNPTPPVTEKMTKARKARTPVGPNEPADAKFRRLANRRMTKALKAIGYVANLGNKRTYEYNDEQKQRILQALVDAVSIVRDKFSGDDKPSTSFTV